MHLSTLQQWSAVRGAMQEGRQPRFTMGEVSPVLNDLLQKLFGAFSLPDSRENEYVMHCVTRVITFVGAEVSLLRTGPSHAAAVPGQIC